VAVAIAADMDCSSGTLRAARSLTTIPTAAQKAASSAALIAMACCVAPA